VFKHAFTKAVEWGLIRRHPFKGEVRLKGIKPRTLGASSTAIGSCGRANH
jgi:hypothetical protein